MLTVSKTSGIIGYVNRFKNLGNNRLYIQWPFGFLVFAEVHSMNFCKFQRCNFVWHTTPMRHIQRFKNLRNNKLCWTSQKLRKQQFIFDVSKTQGIINYVGRLKNLGNNSLYTTIAIWVSGFCISSFDQLLQISTPQLCVAHYADATHTTFQKLRE